MLDDSLGWAWGYAGEERRVGYVAASARARLTLVKNRGLQPDQLIEAARDEHGEQPP